MNRNQEHIPLNFFQINLWPNVWNLRIFFYLCGNLWLKFGSKLWIHNGAGIAQWIRLRLPSCCPGFKSQAHHLCFYQFVLFKLYICHLNWNVTKTKVNKKRPGLPILKSCGSIMFGENSFMQQTPKCFQS